MFYCKGTNEIKLKRCPHTYLSADVRALVPYFFHFVATYQYPDGRGRLYQPVKMLNVFDAWFPIYQELTKKPDKPNE